MVVKRSLARHFAQTEPPESLAALMAANERLQQFAAELASSTSASSLALTKDLLGRLSEMPLPDAMEYSAHLNALARKTDDFKRGLDSFDKKEPPRW